MEFVLKFLVLLAFAVPITISKQIDGTTNDNTTDNRTSDGDDLIVELVNPASKIRGRVLQSAQGNGFYAFQDIPYAKPPVGELRFKTSVAAEQWDGVLNTTQNVRVCPQAPDSDKDYTPQVNESEDCLYLNVYSPVKPGNNESLSVLFWIPGGDFTYGSSTLYDPAYLMDYGIIIVTINYRIGALGFLTTDDQNLPGNLGLKDQQLALQWTYENIGVFGGDAGKITIGGQGAGGSSTGMHILNKKNEGLVRSFIESSGSAIGTTSYQPDYKNIAFEVGKIIDKSFVSTDSSDLLKLLQNANLEDIMNAQMKVSSNNADGIVSNVVWKPIIEDESNTDAFVSGPMVFKFMVGDFNLVPILIGFNSEESLKYLSDEQTINIKAKTLDNDLKLLISDQLNVHEDQKEAAGKEIRSFYTDTSFSDDPLALIKYATDDTVVRGLVRQSEEASQWTPIYMYEFSWEGPQPAKYPGVPNGADLFYLWNYPFSDMSYDVNARPILLKLWSNFVKDSDPTPIRDPELQNIRWPILQPGLVQYLNINKTLEAKMNPRKYWSLRSILEKYVNKPYNVF